MGMLKGWFLGEDGGVYAQDPGSEAPLWIAGSLSALGRVLVLLPESAVNRQETASAIYFTESPMRQSFSGCPGEHPWTDR